MVQAIWTFFFQTNGDFFGMASLRHHPPVPLDFFLFFFFFFLLFSSGINPSVQSVGLSLFSPSCSARRYPVLARCPRAGGGAVASSASGAPSLITQNYHIGQHILRSNLPDSLSKGILNQTNLRLIPGSSKTSSAWTNYRENRSRILLIV